MKLKKTSRSHHGTLNELNITPLLDLAFVLLVIFIITTPQMVNHLEMALPSGQATPPPETAEKPKPSRILVGADGGVFLDEVAVGLPALRSTLEARKRANPDLAVVVNGSDEAPYQGMVSVLDVLQQLDITKVGLATDSVPAR